MADATINTTLISKKNSGFPDYLDFEKLRSEGIDYLGRLSGKIWTDHNVHDPGITILEILCYALIDLGYRTNLPEQDIFTRDPKDSSADNNFLTPSKILACNPLTIIDYRKLLIDIEGVKNAWLEVAKDEKDFCRPPQTDPAGNNTDSNNNNTVKCEEFLNGLYHVYIDLEKNVDKEFDNEADKKKYVEDIIQKVREALMAHRNLCEDFVDVYILCKQETGVCVDIELEDNADVEKVYVTMVEKLRQFFSPSPQFYTLQQLLDKQKPIDEIFAGRPYNITESHGFVDTEELEQLKLRKEIHLSDVYNLLFGIDGVRAVRDLRLQFCNPNQKLPGGNWKFNIPENHVPDFSIQCSGFQFTRNGIPVLIDFEKFDGLFEINFTHNGKILYQQPCPYLDGEIPIGTYRADMADYYSIQNEFPRVYGIADGGLSDNAPALRKAQAYQLKGYLLFFDQLLANYLAQLKNIRNLFAMSSEPKVENHTYFINQLTTVPDHQKLIRFNVNENNSNALGAEGSILVVPVDKEKMLKLKELDELKNVKLKDQCALPVDNDTEGCGKNVVYIDQYHFATLAEQNTAISQVKNDLYYDQFECEFVTRTNECVFYYILTSSDKIALISKKYFKNTEEAKQHAMSVKYIAGFDENYRSFITSANDFSFDIELNLLSFAKYLQLLVEGKELFYQRRQGFLNHLLSRFAEQFTDYAMLSFGFYTSQQLQALDIKNKERFLTQYDDLSSNRGKAYDYLLNNWNNGNVSGFEKKFKAISGIENWKKHSLCNFVVDQYQNQYAVSLRIAGTRYFAAEEKYDTREEALSAAAELFKALKDKSNYQTEYVKHENAYVLKINDAGRHQAVFPIQFATKQEALSVADNITGLFKEKDPAGNVFVSSFRYTPELKDARGKPIRRSVDSYSSNDEAKANSLKSIKRISDPGKWENLEKDVNPGHLYQDTKRTDVLSFINTDAFKIAIDDAIIGKPDKVTYSVLDKENIFKFISVKEFGDKKLATTNAEELLILLTDVNNYKPATDEASGKAIIQISDGKDVQAVSSHQFDGDRERQEFQKKILDIVKKQQYFISVDEKPNRWKFNYQLGVEKNNLHSFESIHEYAKPEEASEAAKEFYKSISDLELKETENALLLAPPANVPKTSAVKFLSAGGIIPETGRKAIKNLLHEQKEIKAFLANPDPEAFSSSVAIDEVSQQGLYVYRLVDKDNIPAFYTQGFATKAVADSAIANLSKYFKHTPIYLKLCAGGDIIDERKDAVTNEIWYHYQLKAINRIYTSGDLAGKSLVLFESTKGYASKEEAEKAFGENYLWLVYLASDPLNYGPGKKISLTEILVQHADPCIKNDSIVFIPAATLKELAPTPGDAVKEMIKLALSYPIRMVRFKSQRFYELFPCEEKEDDEPDDCKKESEKRVYYFSFSGLPGETEYWRSVKFYDDPGEARKDFHFFLILLHYAGNYFVDCDHCSPGNGYRIYIREVLAESAERFLTKEQAWGPDGVEKFICVSQSEDAFHAYQRKNDCCYSFFVACGTGLIYHPCKYDTAKKRDEAILGLYRELNEFIQKKAYQVQDNGGTITLFNGKGESFAVVDTANRQTRCLSDWMTGLVENLGNDKNYKEENGRIVLLNDKNEILARSDKGEYTIAGWKEMLQSFSCYYPIIKTKDEKTGREQYCIEIKLPGFNTCKEDSAEEVPCMCGTEMPEDPHLCHIAWKGRCCYNTCNEAEQALQAIIKLLLNFNYYLPVFDCICDGYGIMLQFSKIEAIPDPRLTYYYHEANISRWHSSELVAINPQCYDSPEMACDAICRAKKLINSEGLHLVEHILLRPRCNPEDCQCPQYSKRCDGKTDCHFEWSDPDEDPCTDDTPVCFEPGADPYSFIATVVLPAWPARFRKKENRVLLENILYREVPAHVLLRILWLAPADFCCFETQYKNWNRWLALKNTCIDDFSVCNFLDILFNRNYECLEECNVCGTCEDVQQPRQPCFVRVVNKEDENKYLNQINDLYCWRVQYCGEYQFIDCDQQFDFRIVDRGATIEVAETPEAITVATEERPIESTKGPTVSRRVEKPEPEKEIIEPKKTEPAVSKSKRQVVNSRMTKYRTDANEVFAKSKQNPIAGKVQSFLIDPEPSIDRLSKLQSEIIQNKEPKVGKPLTKSQSLTLLQSMISYYLDKICFNGKDSKKIGVLKKTMEKLKKEKINPVLIFGYWKMEEVKKYEPELDTAKIRKLFVTADK
jgi:hypothetical protein